MEFLSKLEEYNLTMANFQDKFIKQRERIKELEEKIEQIEQIEQIK